MTTISPSRRKPRGALALLLLAGLPFGGHLTAQEGPLTLEDCLSLARAHNPLILSAEEQIEASMARIRQARAYPQPSLDFDSDLQQKFSDFNRGGERYVGISQTVPFPGKTYLQGRIAGEEAKAVVADADLLKLDIVFQVTESFFSVLRAEEQVGYARQNLEFTQDFVLMTELKYEMGDVALVEVVRARVESATAANDVRVAENEERLARARLNFLLGRTPSSPLSIEGDLRIPVGSYSLEEITGWALQDRPEIQQLTSAIERERLVKRQGFLSYLPDFDVGAAKHKVPGEGDTWDVTLSLALPLFFWQPARGEISEADANLRSLQQEASNLANAITLEVEGAYVTLTTAADQIRLFEEDILDQSQEAYEMYQLAYEQGEIDAIDLIEARRTLNQARTSYSDALFNYDLARAAIEKSIGRPLEEQRNGPDQDDIGIGERDSALSDPLVGRMRERIRGQRRARGSGGV